VVGAGIGIDQWGEGGVVVEEIVAEALREM
jgi:hypothetical protein